MPAPVQFARDYHKIARRLGYRYRHLGGADSSAAPAERQLSIGFLDVEEPQPGLLVTRSDVTLTGGMEGEAEMASGLLIGVALSGPIEAHLEGTGTLSVQPSEAIAIQFDRTAGFAGPRQPSGARLSTLSIFAHPHWLETHGLDALLKPSGRPATALRRWALSPHLRALVAGALRPDCTGPLRRLTTEAMALELLAEALAGAMPDTAAAHALRPVERARILRVRDLLLAAPEAEHSLGRLAREAGISVTVLKDQFKRAFGCSVFDFLRELRLDRAYRGLCDEGWTVAQAAYHAGFRHPTNFAAAFRRRYGFSPRRLRP